MIRLTQLNITSPLSWNFDQNTVTIGAADGGADVPLHEEGIESPHVKLIYKEGAWIALNLANDPFTTINDVPFGKKIVQEGDILQIGQTSLKINFSSSSLASYGPWHDTTIQGILENTIEEHLTFTRLNTSNRPFPLPPTPFVSSSAMQNQEQAETKDLETKALRESDPEGSWKIQEKGFAIDSLAALHSEIATNEREEEVPRITASLKEGPSEEEGRKIDSVRETRKFSPHLWYLALWIFFLGAAITGFLILSWMYYNALERKHNEELRAAAGAADVAMALAYAQIHHLKPQHLNWSDPDFIRHQLAAILPSKAIPLTKIESQGQLSDTPYAIRLYTNSDLSHFIVIAQPNPSVMQWLVPREALVIDSHTMEIRKIVDLRALNRLLISNQALDEDQAREISMHIDKGTLIPLVLLATKKKKGFTPPKALGLIRPGAENRIYNAPRYYLVSEALLDHALLLANNAGAEKENSLLKEEIEGIKRFPDMVLYTTRDLTQARKAQQALNLFTPETIFLTASLHHTEDGIVTASHLLVSDGEEGEIAQAEKEHHNAEENIRPIPLLAARGTKEKGDKDPLSLHYHAIARQRRHQLLALEQQMGTLLAHNREQYNPDFNRQFKTLLRRYHAAERTQQVAAAQHLMELQREHPWIGLEQMVEHVRDAAVESLVRRGLAQLDIQDTEKLSFQSLVQEQFQEIQDADSWDGLQRGVDTLVKILYLDQYPFLDILVSWQQQGRTCTLKKLDHFLLSAETPLSSDAFHSASRLQLQHILRSVWVADTAERDFYLGEFDLLAAHHIPPVRF